MVSKILFALVGLAAASGDASSGFNWHACPFEEQFRESSNITFPFECSNFTVPLDYLDEQSNKTRLLQVSRVPAVNGESQGTIFFNFGGPGLEARQALISNAEQLLTITEGKFDLVASDPRGTGAVGNFRCYNTTEAPIKGLELDLQRVGGPDDERVLARAWASSKNYAGECLVSKENAPELGEVVGTGYAARDLMRMVDALEGEDGLLNFWGVSYGSILAQTVAALFPERMGRVISEANVNVQEYYHGYELEWFRDADAAVLDFFERCVDAGPELCPLASRNQTAEALEKTFYKVLEDLRTAPVPLGGTTVLDKSALQTSLRIGLYGPDRYPVVAAIFSELFKPADQRNITALSESWTPFAASTDVRATLTDDSSAGIFCGDKTLRNDKFSDVFPDLADRFRDVSRSLGDMANGLDYPCLQWPWHAKGAYNGSWHEEKITKNPLLFIGNTYDPVAPLSNARNSSEIFKGSVVLEHGGIGHGSLGHSSLCTARAVRAYFQEGKLPDEDINCTADFGTFEIGKTWKDSLFPELSWDNWEN